MHNTFKQYLFLIFICIGSLNIAAIASEQDTAIEAPEFSHTSGFYPEEFKLKITHPDPKAKIYYTLDGSTPDPNNLKGSTFKYKNHYAQPPNKPSGELLEMEYRTYPYVKPLHIKDRTFEPDRISQISTTFDEDPDYFPKPKPRAGLKNSILHKLNRVVDGLNYTTEKLNWFINGVKHRFGLFFKGLKYQHKVKEYFPLITHFNFEKEYLYKGTPVRAIAVKGEMQSRIEEGIYFIGDRDQFSLPIVNITVREKDLFDYEEGVFVAGIDYDNFLASGKVVKGAAHHRPANWKRKGDNIYASLQIINHAKEVGEIIGVDLRLNGGGSRALRNKTLRIYPRKEYSINGIQSSLFGEEEGALGFSRILFRNSGNGASARTYFADAVIQRAFKPLNFGIQRYQPYAVFINGEYNGILNARDRHDKYYLGKTFDLPTHKVDLLNNNKGVKEGDVLHWEQTLSFIKEAERESPHFFRELENLIDTSSFIDYYSAEIFLVNKDWPGNNIRYWRYKGTEKHPITESGYTDGRWRWLLFDVDNVGGGWGGKYSADAQMLEFATKVGNKGWPNPDWSTFVLRTLLENPEFKTRFITRFSDLLNSTFLPNRMEAIIRDAEKGIEKEMPRHIERWKTPKSMKHWRDSVNSLVNFFHERPKYQWQHLEEFFNLEGRYQVNVTMALNNSSSKKGGDFGRIQLNTLTLGEPKPQNPDVTYTNLALPWQGDYFKNLPLVVETIPAEGYQFSHWEVEGITLTEEEQKSLKLRIQPERDLQLRAVVIEATGK